MMSVFRRDLDPHLVTALDMAQRQRKSDYGENLIEWLASKDERERSLIKGALRDERQNAKPANFGLLYGMSAKGLHQYGISNYGLSWTPEEAAHARNAWFQLYPEFQLWQWWTKHQQSRNINENKCAVWNPYERKLIMSDGNARLYETKTTAGRRFAILDNLRKALNYQDQGTGADILCLAIASLPQDIAKLFLFPVHDELVFEVPTSEIADVKERVISTMQQAAVQVLAGQIPIKVEPSSGETWCKE